jgi:type I restriction enzyme M protein
MIAGEVRSKIDKVWEATFLLFIRRLDELQTAKEQKATFLKKPVDKPIFAKKQEELRWSRFKNTDPDVMYRLFTKENGVFDFLKSVAQNGSVLSRYMKVATFMVPTPR